MAAFCRFSNQSSESSFGGRDKIMNIIVNKPKPATAQTTEKITEIEEKESTGDIALCFLYLNDLVKLLTDFIEPLLIQKGTVQ